MSKQKKQKKEEQLTSISRFKPSKKLLDCISGPTIGALLKEVNEQGNQHIIYKDDLEVILHNTVNTLNKNLGEVTIDELFNIARHMPQRTVQEAVRELLAQYMLRYNIEDSKE